MRLSISKAALLRFYSVILLSASLTFVIGVLAFFIKAEIGDVIVGIPAPTNINVLKTADSTVIGCGGTTSDPNITLTWDAIEGVNDYCVNDNNPNDGVCDYTPVTTSQDITLAAEGTYTFNIAGRDVIPNNGEFASCIVTYDVPIPENQPPIIINEPADLTVIEGEPQEFTFSGQDSDGQVIRLCYVVTGTGITEPATVCLDANPAGATASWSFSTSYPVGIYTYTYTVFDDDEAQSTESTFVLTVNPEVVSERPYVDPVPGNQTVELGTVVNQTVSSHDTDGNVVRLCYTRTFNSVTDSEVCTDATTPASDVMFDLILNLDTSTLEIGEYTYHYYVVDNEDLRSDADLSTDGLQDYTFILTIEPVDEIPVVTEPDDMTIVVGTDSEFSFTGTDDNQIVNFCYTLNSDSEVCLPATGTVPTYTWVFQTETLPIGIHTYVYYVTDNAGQQSITHAFVITVNPENQKPYVLPIPADQTVTRGDSVDLTAIGHDDVSVVQLCYTRTFNSITDPEICIDAAPEGPTVTFNILENLDTTLMLPGVYTYEYYDIDDTDLRSDSDDSTDGDQDYTFELTIEPLTESEDPYISPLAPNISINEGQSFTTTFSGHDSDSPLYQLCIQLQGQPTTLSCTLAGANTGAYTWQFSDVADTSILYEGTYTYEYYVEDFDGNRSDSNLTTVGDQNYSFNLTISNVKPSVSLGSSQTILVGQSATFTGSFNDPSFLSHSPYYDGGANTPDDGPWFVYINYGDGNDTYYTTNNVGNLSVPAHTYNSPGGYQVYLYVFEDSAVPGEGTFGYASVTVVVNSVVPPINDSFPQAYIIANPGTTVSVGQTITFSASVVNGNGPFSYYWYGNCSGTSSSTTVSTNIAGIYSCGLRVTDADGDQSYASVAYVFTSTNNNGGDDGDTDNIDDPNTSNVIDDTTSPASYPGIGSAGDISDNILGEVTCSQKSKVSGVVFYDKNENGEIDGEELGIFDVKVKFYLLENNAQNLIKIVKTDEEGRFELSLCPGYYKVQIVKEDLPEEDKLIGEDTKDVEVKLGENISNLNFQVKDEDGGFNWLLCIIPIVILLLLGIIAAILAARREDPEEYYSRNVEQY